MTGFKDFYDTITENLKSYNVEYESFINYGPNLFKLLCDLLNCEIDNSLRLEICAAIAYYVAPMDVIPEIVYGPYGYIDNIYLSIVLKKVAKIHGYEFIQDIWENPSDIKEVIDECEARLWRF